MPRSLTAAPREREGSKRRTVQSLPPLASSLPSGLKAMLQISFVCPSSVSRHSPSGTRQSLMVLSELPLAIRESSTGLKAALVTQLLWPVSVRTFRPPSAENSRKKSSGTPGLSTAVFSSRLLPMQQPAVR